MQLALEMFVQYHRNLTLIELDANETTRLAADGQLKSANLLFLAKFSIAML